jgi:hypothetical protein
MIFCKKILFIFKIFQNPGGGSTVNAGTTLPGLSVNILINLK